jgi:probable O-glycosylation ligase (exosortase A-associated)
VRDLALVAFLVALLGLGLRRPFLFVLAYVYVDTVSPQRLSYYLLNSVPLSMIVAALALAGWLIADDKRHFRIAGRQWLMLILLAYAGYTTLQADLPIEASSKWEWVWKAMAWSIFLPLTLNTRLRIESLLLFLTLSAAAIIIVGGIKTVLSGGGYGVLNLMVDNNSGLYESSTIATVAIALIPVILWLARFGTLYPRDWRVRAFAYCLIFACLLIPVGTEARTGLVCIAALVLFMLREAKNRIAYMVMIALAVAVAVPFLPQSFTGRMSTIQTYEADSSASTRLAVWAWTWDYVQEHPFGGGFEAYRQNKLRIDTVATESTGAVEVVDRSVHSDQGRAYHSSYFEMLGEQGFPGLLLFLLIHGTGVIRMEVLRRRYRHAEEDKAWLSPLATALQNAQLVYLVGSLFVGIAWQPFIYMLIAVQVGFDGYASRTAGGGARRPWRKPPAAPTPSTV